MQLLRSADTEASTPAHHVEDSIWTLLDDEVELASLPEDGALAISYSRYVAEPEFWNARSAPWTLVIDPAAELLEIAPEVLARDEILVAFPAFTDGRGYSHAATLRQRHGYTGGLVAVGDVRRDQLDFMRDSGFTAFEITGNDSVEDMLVSLDELEMPADHRLYSGAAL